MPDTPNSIPLGPGHTTFGTTIFFAIHFVTILVFSTRRDRVSLNTFTKLEIFVKLVLKLA